MTKTITLKPLMNESLADLFLAMAMKEDDRQSAENAFNEFYNRYNKYLYTIISNACKNWIMYGADLVKSVFQNTLLTVFDKADNFLEIEDIPIERQEKRLKAWLGRIAEREMYLLLRELRTENESIDYLDDLTSIDSSEEEVTTTQSEDAQLVERALKTLSERDRNILITYLMYEDGNKKLPRSEIQRLAALWDVLPDNMRQIRKRSQEKVKKYIETYKKK